MESKGFSWLRWHAFGGVFPLCIMCCDKSSTIKLAAASQGAIWSRGYAKNHGVPKMSHPRWPFSFVQVYRSKKTFHMSTSSWLSCTDFVGIPPKKLGPLWSTILGPENYGFTWTKMFFLPMCPQNLGRFPIKRSCFVYVQQTTDNETRRNQSTSTPYHLLRYWVILSLLFFR